MMSRHSLAPFLELEGGLTADAFAQGNDFVAPLRLGGSASSAPQAPRARFARNPFLALAPHIGGRDG
jgi:hypothetical protein